MEKGIIIFIILAITAVTGLFFTLLYVNKLEDKRIYVYPKTGNQYKILYRCKMKLPIEGIWIDALIYVGLKDGHLYVRERKDFLNKFVKLIDYKNGKK